MSKTSTKRPVFYLQVSRAMENCPLVDTRNCPLVAEESVHEQRTNRGKPSVE
jgi:hypothetical protein